MPSDYNSVPISEPTFYVLLCLADGPKHGYAVLKDAEMLSKGQVMLSVSTLYTALGRLQEQGLIERVDGGEDEPAPGLPRKVYQLTRQGQRALEAEAGRLRSLLAAYYQRLGLESK